MNRTLKERVVPEWMLKDNGVDKPVHTSSNREGEREIFPGYVTDGNFPQTIVHQAVDFSRPADYIPGRIENAWVRLSLVYWNQAKLEEGKLFVCTVGKGRNEERLERLLSYAYRVENMLSHGEGMLKELKGLFKQVVG